MEKTLRSVDEVKQMIEAGKVLSLAGDESVLKALPKGNWIGGTIPYFMTKDRGGVFSKEEIYVDDFSKFAEEIKIVSYNKANFKTISDNLYKNGFTLFIPPASSEVHEYFALNYWQIKNLYKNPFVGWVSGFDMNDKDGVAKTLNGLTGNLSPDDAVAMHVKLPDNKKAGVSIVNILEQDTSADSIQFLQQGFIVEDCLVNDEKVNFAEYLANNNLTDGTRPLISDYSGIKINVAIAQIDSSNKKVHLFAPVFENRIYKFAKPLADYASELEIKMSKHYNEKAFSCNCYLNWLFGELENKTLEIGGPITFGEIAYNLLNQTLVYMTINDRME